MYTKNEISVDKASASPDVNSNYWYYFDVGVRETSFGTNSQYLNSTNWCDVKVDIPTLYCTESICGGGLCSLKIDGICLSVCQSVCPSVCLFVLTKRTLISKIFQISKIEAPDSGTRDVLLCKRPTLLYY